MKRGLAVLLAVVMIGGLALSSAGCAKKETTLKIGVVAPMTGDAPTFGESTRNGVMLAVEQRNAKGGLLGMQIQPILADDKADPVEAANAGRKLINQDKVKAIIGSVYSVCSLAIAPIAQQNKIPMISPTSTNIKVTQEGDYIFRACYIDPFQGYVMAKFAREDLKASTGAVIYDVNNDYTKGLAEEFKRHFEALGGRVVGFESYATGDKDFKAQLTKLKATNADVLFLPDYYQTSALIARQAREMAWNVQLIGADGWDSEDLVKIGGTALEGGFHSNHYSPESDSPIAQKFLKDYKDKYGKTPDALAALAYDAALILFDAIERAKSTDGKAIRDAMAATNIEGVSGLTTFDQNRNPVKGAVIIKIQGGKPVFYKMFTP
jgi:branched-chain amino acid transport system substrate-binding protein